ncbi:MAG: hypothetical protein KIT25_08425 [Enhydrobacter sp.]|nr:MAG: hypothetical protein KIT25_08425 [Enhydrobacter sp.]
MYKFLGALFGAAAADQFWTTDDKIVALLIVILAVVWVAVPPGRPNGNR